MVTVSQVPAAVEGKQIIIAGQDIKPIGRPNKILETNEIVYPLKVRKRGDATIEEEKNPKTADFKDYSLLNLGDKISGSDLWGFSSEPIGPGDVLVGGAGRTSSHSGQELNISGTCFMVLIHGWRGYAIAIHPSTELLK